MSTLADRIPPVLGELGDEELEELRHSLADRVTAISLGRGLVGASPVMDEQHDAYASLLQGVEEEIAWRSRRAEVGRTVFIRSTSNPRLLLAVS